MASPFAPDKELREPRGGVLVSPTRPKADAGYRAGAAVRRFFSAPTAYGAMGQSNLQQSRAQSSAAAPVRSFARGVAGAAPAGAAPSAAPPRAARPVASIIPAAQAAERPAAAGTAAPAPATPMHLIEPSRPQSMQAAPSARRPSTPPPTPAAAPSPTVGTFQGRPITADQAQAAAARLPTAAAGAAPVAGPNDGVAFAPPGSTVASPPSAAPPVPAQAAAPAVPRTTVDGRAMRQAAQGRAAELSRLNDVIGDMEFRPSGLNMRSKRQLYADLIGRRGDLVRQEGDIAAGDVASQRQTGTSRDVAAMGEQGANQRSAADNQRAREIAELQESGADRRTRIAQRPERIVRADGTVGLVDDSARFTPVTGPDGQPVRAQADRDTGAVTPAIQYKALNDRLTELQSFGRPRDEAEAAKYDRQVADLTGRMAALEGGGGAAEPPPVAGARKAADGNWYVQNDDGSYSKVTP